MLDISLSGVGTVLHLERDAWSMVNWLRQATNVYLPTPGHKPSKTFLRHIRGKRNECPNVGGVSIRSRNGAHSSQPNVHQVHAKVHCWLWGTAVYKPAGATYFKVKDQNVISHECRLQYRLDCHIPVFGMTLTVMNNGRGNRYEQRKRLT